MNHPTKYLFQYICKIILNELNFDTTFINLNVDPLFHNERGILYKCIQNVVHFNINEYTPQLSKYNLNDINQIVEKYYNTYDNILL